MQSETKRTHTILEASKTSISAYFTAFSLCSCLRILLLKRWRNIEPGNFYPNSKQELVPQKAPSLLCSCIIFLVFVKEVPPSFLYFFLCTPFFAKILLQMIRTCVNLSVFYEVSLFHKMTSKSFNIQFMVFHKMKIRC